jgi:hypothetical protein
MWRYCSRFFFNCFAAHQCHKAQSDAIPVHTMWTPIQDGEGFESTLFNVSAMYYTLHMITHTIHTMQEMAPLVEQENWQQIQEYVQKQLLNNSSLNSQTFIWNLVAHWSWWYNFFGTNFVLLIYVSTICRTIYSTVLLLYHSIFWSHTY